MENYISWDKIISFIKYCNNYLYIFCLNNYYKIINYLTNEDNNKDNNKDNLNKEDIYINYGKENIEILTYYFKAKLASNSYQRIKIATKLMQKKFRQNREERLIKSTNNIDDFFVKKEENGYYNILSKSIYSYLGY